jgi:hypothetical protein
MVRSVDDRPLLIRRSVELLAGGVPNPKSESQLQNSGLPPTYLGKSVFFRVFALQESTERFLPNSISAD